MDALGTTDHPPDQTAMIGWAGGCPRCRCIGCTDTASAGLAVTRRVDDFHSDAERLDAVSSGCGALGVGEVGHARLNRRPPLAGERALPERGLPRRDFRASTVIEARGEGAQARGECRVELVPKGSDDAGCGEPARRRGRRVPSAPQEGDVDPGPSGPGRCRLSTAHSCRVWVRGRASEAWKSHETSMTDSSTG